MPYAFADEHAADPAKIGAALNLTSHLTPLARSSPQWIYLTKTRKLPAKAVQRCSTDIACLAPPIPYFGAQHYGVVSLIRADDGEVIGFAVEACGPAGEAVRRDGRTLRRFFNLTDERLSAGLFRAVVVEHCDRAIMVEGHLAKAIAAAAAFPDRSVYGWGSRPWLGLSVPPENEILIIEDREPAGD